MENILAEIGQCGKFQICHVAIINFCRYVSSWAFSLMVFGLYNPGWKCIQENTAIPGSNLSLFPAVIFGEGETNFNQINSDYGVDIDSNVSHSNLNGFTKSNWPFSAYNEVVKRSGSSSTDFSSYNGTCDVINSCSAIEMNPDSSTVVSEFGLICDRIWIAYVIVSVLQAGMLAGALVSGHIGERFGRRKTFYGCIFISSTSCGLGMVSQSWQVYAVFMFFVGFGVVVVMPMAAILCNEFLTSTWRARIISIPVWNLGLISFACLTYLLRDWRLIHLICAVAGGISCLGFFWTPESVRWLIVHGHISEADNVLYKIANLNNKRMTPDITKQLLNEYEADSTTKRHYTYMDLFRTKSIAILVTKLAILRTITALTYDILGFGIQALPGDFYSNILISTILDLPFVLSIGPIANKIGRRWSSIMLLSVGVLCCSVIMFALLIIDIGQTRGILITSMALTNKAAISVMTQVFFLHATELLPTAIRNLAFGFFSTSSRVLCILGPFLLPRDSTSMVVCFAALLFAQLLGNGLVLSMAETRDKPLDDVIKSNLNKRRSDQETIKMKDDDDDIDDDDCTDDGCEEKIHAINL